jgi:uncharacterized protein with HEPN domain
MTDKHLRAVDYLGHMLDAIYQMSRYTAGMDEPTFLGDRLIQDAVVRNIEILGEAAKNVRMHAPGVAESHPEVPWLDIYGMRNRLAHGYFDVNYHAVWQVIVKELPVITPLLRAVAKELEQGPTP